MDIYYTYWQLELCINHLLEEIKDVNAEAREDLKQIKLDLEELKRKHIDIAS